jgi:hypothetical protein
MECKIKQVCPVRFREKLSGKSQSALIDANDGSQYVVKWLNNLYGPQLVFNEALGSSLFAAFGLPVPPWTAIVIASDFIDANPEMWFDTRSGKVKQSASLNFASLSVVQPERTVYEVLPGSWFPRLVNREAFLGAMVLDIWMGNLEHRKALFVENDHTLEAVFVNHAHMLGGPDGCASRHQVLPSYLDQRVYAGLDVAQGLNSWANHLAQNGEYAVKKALAGLPQEWVTSSAEAAVDELIRSIPEVRERVCAAAASLWAPKVNWQIPLGSYGHARLVSSPS